MPALVPNCEEKCPLKPDVPSSADLQSREESLSYKESANSLVNLVRAQENPDSNPNTALQLVDSSASGSTNDQYAPLRSSSKWISFASLLRIRLPTGHTGQLL